jgi:hypothetical protein
MAITKNKIKRTAIGAVKSAPVKSRALALLLTVMMLMTMATALSACNPPTPDPGPTPVGEGPTITFDVSNTTIQVSENAVTSTNTDGDGDLEFSVTPAAGMSVLWYDSMDANGNRLTINDEGNNTYKIVGATVDAEVYFISWPKTSSSTPSFTGGGTEASPYVIADEGDLQQLAVDVFDGYLYKDNYFALTANLDLSGFEWLPIGGGAAPTPRSFNGHFDGANHTISGINYDHSAGNWSRGSSIKNNIGLFGKVEVGASVSNLTIENGNIAAQRAVGGIVGTSWGTIDNCHNSSVPVTFSQTQGGGGIAGASRINGEEDPPSTPKISNCTNDAAVESTLEANPNPEPDGTKGGSAGGIVGENEGLLYNCSNTGDITSNWNAGGLVGANQNNVQQEKYAPLATVVTLGYIMNSYNAGAVTGYCAGGIVGYQFASAENVYNHGTVSGTYAGDIIGELAVDTTDLSITNDYLYYRIGTDAVGQETSGDFNENGGYEYDPTGDDPDLPDMSELLTSLNAWVTNNQTTPPTYKTWKITAENDGYPVFS